MQTVKQGQLTLALLSKIPPRLRIHCLLLHWEFHRKPQKLLPASTIFSFSFCSELSFFSPPFLCFYPSFPPFCLFTLLELHPRTEQWSVWLLRSFYSAWTLFSDVCGCKTCLGKINLWAGKRMGILRVCAGSACLLTLSCLGFRLGRVNWWLWGCMWLRKEEGEKCAGNFSICQLFPILEWAMVASPWHIYQEM